jgi:hypothetical protein
MDKKQQRARARAILDTAAALSDLSSGKINFPVTLVHVNGSSARVGDMSSLVSYLGKGFTVKAVK